MIKFTKMHGLGNDYIYVDRRENKNIIPEEKIPSFTRYTCNRHFGIGGDGVIFIEDSKIADFKMRIFNPDGSLAEMCGNGIRCFAKLVYEDKLTNKTNLSIETLAGIKYTSLRIEKGEVKEVEVNMGKPILKKEKIPVISEENKEITEIKINIENQEFLATCVSMGNPHAVIVVNDVEKIDIQKYGPIIEADKRFPNRINVEFVQILDKGHIKMRVWERGTGETYACGTGACAAMVACNLKGYTRRNAKVYLRGGELKIRWDEKNDRVYMTGIATKVFTGEI